MKKALTFIIAAVAFFVAHSQQQTILLFTEDFDNGPSSIIFDSAGPSTNAGNNDWIVNNLYDGHSIYPNTPNEDSTTSGLIINNAPFSNYLHIHDVAATSSGIVNDNWDPNNGSDRFCYLGSSFCTLGLTDVQFTFDWICEGSSSAYGLVYYRSGAGPWTRIGQPRYYNQGKWAYESIQDARLNNQQNIQIGFRWINPGSGGTSDVAFGIDDIFAVGSYNIADTSNAVTLSAAVYDPVTFLPYNITICQGSPIVFGITLSNALCDGTYEVEMSDANGSFRNPYNLGVLGGGPNFLGGLYNSLPTDGNLSGNCFRIRIVRTSPAPFITSDTSICFAIVPCPNTITNVMAPVMNDADTTCIQSEIDVKFNSTGVFKAGNTYYAELSDSNGNFADSTLLGTLPVRDSFPSIPPGNISGLIPASVPPGCGYYIRVRSTKPPTVGPPIGPYCLKHCDELTNKIQDLHFCVASGPYPTCDSINIADNHWDTLAKYATCNKWIIELRSMKDFSLVNSGGLGVYHDNVSGNFELCMPANAGLLPVPPGAYYMRIVSTCSNEPWNQTGTVIRITIGAPSARPSTIILSDTAVCPGSTVSFFVSPFNSPPSQYQWTSTLINGGAPFIWPYSGFSVGLLPFTPQGTYITTVQEINFGCYGPFSPPADLTVFGAPTVAISGPSTVCIGDTARYNVTFLNETYYSWTISPGAKVLNESNVQTTIVFDTMGIFNVSNFSLNNCGSDSGSVQVRVLPPSFKLNTGPDTTICLGDSVIVNAGAGDMSKTFQVLDTGSSGKQGGMFNLIAHSDLTIDSFAVKLKTRPQTLMAEIYGKHGSYISFEQSQSAWNLLAKNYNNPTAPTGQFTTISAPVNQFIAKGDTFAFYVTTANVPELDIDYGVGDSIQGTLYNSDGNLDFIQGTVLDYKFTNNIPVKGYVLNVEVFYSTKAGFIYQWSNGNTTREFEIAPQQSESLAVQVTDQGRCGLRDSMHITVLPIPSVNAGPDTAVCPGRPYIMQGSSSSPFVVWQPSTGLDSANNPHAVFNYTDSVTFVLVATDPSTHCMNRDTVNILVPLRLSVGPDTTICEGNTDTLRAISTGDYFVWSPSLGLNDSSILDPVFSPIGGAGAEFTVTAADKNGCKLSGSVKIDVVNCNSKIVAPTAFTPSFSGNGTGKPDDHFVLWGKNVQEYEVRIYNRWGELVYDSGMMGGLNGDYSPPLWDGKFKGKIQDTGTFVYYINGRDINGKSIEQKGNLTLIR